MNVIREFLHIKHNFANMTLYSKQKIDFILEYCFRFFVTSFYVCVLCAKLKINK